MAQRDSSDRRDRRDDDSEKSGESTSTLSTKRRTVLTALATGATGAALPGSGVVAGRIQGETETLQRDVSLLDLVSETDATHRAVQDGHWDDASVWADGEVPGDDARVLVEPDTAVTVAHQGTSRLRAVRVDGTLTFDPTVDTRLQVDTLVTHPESKLQIGTAETPIEPDVEARITVIDTGPIDEEQDPERKGRGLVANGDVVVHGASTTPWTELESAPAAGDSQLTLPEAPTNWQAGDRLVVPGVTHEENQDEERRIAAVDGTTVSLDSALAYDHAPPAADLDSYAVNLSRNVVFESESTDVPRRGHTMFMSTGTDVRYAAFRELGRTDKSKPFSDPMRGESPTPAGENVKARYAFHYHKTGIDADEPHVAEGLVAESSPGWGIVNHHSYAHVRDSVTYDVLGAGFVAEGGNERGSFTGNFALRSEGSGETIDARAHGAHGGDPAIDDFGHAGHGFWFQSPLVEVIDNVAAGHRHQAFVWWLRPLLDGPLAEGTEIEDSRVSFWPNLPVEYVDTDRPLWEAIQEGRFGEHDQLCVDTQKIPSTFAPVNAISGNTAFAAAGGVDFSRHNFKWKHERFSEFTALDDFTVHSIGAFADDEGEIHEPELPRHRMTGHQGRGGSVGVSLRYTSNVTLRNSHLVGTGREHSVGVPYHDYLWTTTVENSTIEGWDWGVDTGEHRLTWIRNNTLRDNSADVNWGLDNTGPAIIDGNDLETVRHDFEPNNQKAEEVFEFGRTFGVRIDGRTSYVEESAPDHVPFPDEDSLGGINNIESTLDSVDDETALIGKSNADLQDEFGISVGGALMPDDAVSEPFLQGAKLDPVESRTPPRTVWMDAADASGGSFETVDAVDAAGGKALRCTGSDAPRDEPASLDFECAAGTYKLAARVWPDSWNGNTVHFRLNGGEWLPAEKLKPASGFEWHDVEPNDGDPYQVNLSEGTHTLDIACGNDDVLLDEVFLSSDGTVLGAYGESARSTSPDTTDPEDSAQSPYTDHDLSRIEAEDFDTGGEGVAYHDTSSGNNGGAYRDTDVDIQETSDEGGGYNLGWLAEGEWWEYTVEVPSDGTYELRARLAGKNATTLDVAVDGSQAATVDVPNTGDWQNWTTVDAGAVDLSSGTRTVRLTANGGSFNVNWFGFEAGDAPNETPTATDDAVTVRTGRSVTIDALSNDSDADGSLDASSVTVVSSPSNGSTTVNSDGTIDYAHDGSDTSSDSFGYTVDDDAGATSNEATVSVTVAKTIEVKGDGAASYGNGKNVRYIIETSGSVEPAGTGVLESTDGAGGSKASGKVPTDGSDADAFSLTGGNVSDVSTWGGDVTVTVDGTEWSG